MGQRLPAFPRVPVALEQFMFGAALAAAAGAAKHQLRPVAAVVAVALLRLRPMVDNRQGLLEVPLV